MLIWNVCNGGSGNQERVCLIQYQAHQWAWIIIRSLHQMPMDRTPFIFKVGGGESAVSIMLACFKRIPKGIVVDWHGNPQEGKQNPNVFLQSTVTFKLQSVLSLQFILAQT